MNQKMVKIICGVLAIAIALPLAISVISMFVA